MIFVSKNIALNVQQEQSNEFQSHKIPSSNKAAKLRFWYGISLQQKKCSPPLLPYGQPIHVTVCSV